MKKKYYFCVDFFKHVKPVNIEKTAWMNTV
jgi:hypothetical protein